MSKANEYSGENITVRMISGQFDKDGILNVKEGKGVKIQVAPENAVEIKVENYTFKELPDGRAIRIDKNGNQLGKPLSKEEYRKVVEKQNHEKNKDSKEIGE